MNTSEEQSASGVSMFVLAWKWLRAEAVITWRMVRDNLPVGTLTVPLSALNAGIGGGLNGAEILVNVCQALVIGFLIVYIYDCWNQAQSLEEDARNKPYRPVPAGLATPQGIQLRGWIATALYIFVAWLFGLWLWVLPWPFIIMVPLRWGPPRGYLWWKLVANLFHQVLMFAIGWNLSIDLDSAAWIWILVMSTYFTFVYIIEDVRDLDGDRAAGRLTPVMVLGRTFVCRFFAVLMMILPFFIYFLLALMSDADEWKYLLAAVILGALSWTSAVRALFLQGHEADRITYKFCCFVWALTCTSGPLFLA